MCKKCCMELQRKSIKSSACSTAAHRLPKTGLDVTGEDNAVTQGSEIWMDDGSRD